MVGITEIGGALSSLKAAMDIAKGIQALDTDAKVKLATMDLMEKILSAQQDAFAAQEAQSTLLQRIRELEEEVRQGKVWNDEQQRYELKEFPTGVMAYVLKPDAAKGEPSHRICPACYQEGHKSILQTIGRHRGGETVECPKCKVRLTLTEYAPVQVDSGRGGWSA